MSTKTDLSRGGLGWYLEQITQTPLLSIQQEQQLARRVREHNDPVAREQMIQANLRLVVNIAKRYSKSGIGLADLVAEGNLGLVRAVEEFKPEAGVRFSTYAAWWIKQTIKRLMINGGQPVRIPAYMAQQVAKWRRAVRQLEETLGRQPTLEEVAAKLHISPKKAGMIAQGIKAVNSPTQMPSEESQVLAEMLDSGQDGELFDDQGDAAMVREVLGQLPPRERKILTYRFGLDGYQGPPRTLKQVGAMIGLTRERVRQLEKESLAKLHELMEDKI